MTSPITIFTQVDLLLRGLTSPALLVHTALALSLLAVDAWSYGDSYSTNHDTPPRGKRAISKLLL